MTVPNGFKPNLAINIDDVKTQPEEVYVSEKLDGVRVIFFDGVAYSRSLKPIPNKHIQDIAKQYTTLNGCDGEIIAGDKHAKDVLQRSVSFAMKESKEDTFHVYLFDRMDVNNPSEGWFCRYNNLKNLQLPKNFSVLTHYPVSDKSEENIDLNSFEREVLALGGEGCILRDKHGLYKFGRSGKIKPSLQKLKKFDDAEFEVVGYEQLESNQNAAKTNELGRTSRSSCKEGKVLVDTLGSLVLKLQDGRTFNTGSGFTEKQREALWLDREELIGRLAKIKYFGYSPDGIPLLPIFLDFRSELDL